MNTESINAGSLINTIDGKFELLGLCRQDTVRLIELVSHDGISGISPNPATGKVLVKLNNNNKVISKLIMYNSIGNNIEEFEIKPGESILEINTMKYSAGIYYLKYRNEYREQTEKLIIEK